MAHTALCRIILPQGVEGGRPFLGAPLPSLFVSGMTVILQSNSSVSKLAKDHNEALQSQRDRLLNSKNTVRMNSQVLPFMAHFTTEN